MIHFVNALLKDTLDEVKAEKVRSNASKVIQMLESYLCNGYPLITEKYPLEKPIKDAGVIAKFEKAIKSGMDSSNQQANGFESYIDSLNDIRPTKWLVKNGSFGEVILFDIFEYLDTIIDKEGNIIHEEVNGEIKFNADISKPVQITVYPALPSELKTITFHDCMLENIEAFENERVLPFLVPQGEGSLITYRVENPRARVPFELSHNIKQREDTLHIDITVRHISIRGTLYTLSDFHGKFFLPEGLSQKESSTSKGAIRYNEKNATMLWKVGEFDKQETVKLNLSFAMNGKNIEDLSPITLCLKFQADLYSYSGIKIEKATFKDPECKYGKKARAIAKSGFYEIRMT